jgi:hypothetical protein
MHSHIDRRHFAADLLEITGRIRHLKRGLGARWERPMAAEQRELYQLKLRATELCVLRAFTRGKLHVRWRESNDAAASEELEYHRRIAERLGPVYSIRLEQSA